MKKVKDNIIIDRNNFTVRVQTRDSNIDTEELRKKFSELFLGWEFAVEYIEKRTNEKKARNIAIDFLNDQFASFKALKDHYSVIEDDNLLTVILPPVYYKRFNLNNLDEELIEILKESDCNIKLNIQSSNNTNKIDTSVFDSVKIKRREKSNALISDSFSSWAKGRDLDIDTTPIAELNENNHFTLTKGKLLSIEKIINTRRGRTIVHLDFGDENAMAGVFFCSKNYAEENEIESVLIPGNHYLFWGQYRYDDYQSEYIYEIHRIQETIGEKDVDEAKDKRIELHLHSKMSENDGLIDIKELFSLLEEWEHEAVAITDHAVVQAFPEFYQEAKSKGIKPILGMEAYVVPDKPIIMKNTQNKEFNTCVVFDLETTGLNQRKDKIIEIGAIKLINGERVDSFSAFVDPEMPLPSEIVALTGIENSDLLGQKKINEVLPEFLKFCNDALLVAHNADFDISFISRDAKELGLEYNFSSFDTLAMAQILFPEQRSHRLDRMCRHYGIDLKDHHRALEDAKATSFLFLKLLDERNIDFSKIDSSINNIENNREAAKNRPYHLNILVKNLKGLKNLYDLVSYSHIESFYMTPRIPESVLKKHKEGLLLGSSCSDGPILQGIISNYSESKMIDLIKNLDYIELQPPENWEYLTNRGIMEDLNDIESVQKEIVRLAKIAKCPIVATSDAHFLNKEDIILREIIKKGRKAFDPKQKMPFYLRKTNEMLDSFSFLGDKIAREIVISNTHLISDMIEDVEPILPGTHVPTIKGSDEDLRKISYKNAEELYGLPLPTVVEARLERELNSVISNGYAVLYIISRKLVRKSNEDGYVVGSRGSVGSSFVATMADISEVNPLIPHYLCKKCKFSEFFDDGEYDSGIDLPSKNCPKCGEKLHRDGHDIPFEVFLGFEGDKEPDIDLNFAGEYQARAHQFVEELFGDGKVVRAGTIGTIQNRTAYGYVHNFLDEEEIFIHPAEERELMRGIVGVKRSSSQHPGGLMIVPENNHIHDFTPVQYPANSSGVGNITTHFSYQKISNSILKLDLLGHDVPTIIRLLEDMTGIGPDKVPLDDQKTMDIFTSDGREELISTLGIPEFGTPFVRDMLKDTNPTTFGELVRISGLSHGTDVWLGNAKDLIDQGIAELKDTICTRDDIMRSLILWGLKDKDAFDIMERVRRGQGLSLEMIEKMRAHEVPEWYIDSCLKIKYMFPKAHAVAYVLMSYRIAWFKVHYPSAFYAAYLTVKIQDIPESALAGQKESVQAMMDLEQKRRTDNLSVKEEAELSILQIVNEMMSRDINMEKIDLYKSPIYNFNAIGNTIYPPLRAVPGISDAMAKNLDSERKKEFTSKENILKRTCINKTALEGLEIVGALKDLPDTDQLSFF